MVDRFQENVSLWSKSNPIPSVFLPYLESRFSYCKTDKGELNLKMPLQGSEVPIHSMAGAMEEMRQWFDSLDLTGIEVLYVFGVGLGYAYHVAQPWLGENPHRSLVFLEDNLEIIRRLFENENGSLILNDKQVQLTYFQNLEDKSSPLNELYWNFLNLKMTISALPFYLETRKDLFIDLKHKVFYDSTLRHSYLQEYLNYGIPFYRNFYPNMLRTPGASLGDGLQGKFKGIPAIICGAGPSLSKQLNLLRDLLGKALIFAGGSSLNALNSEGIQPHLGAGVDPNPEQLKRLKSNTAFEVPFVYRTRMEHRAFQMINGPKLYISGSGGYDTSKWFEEKLGIECVDIDEGYNVVNFCTDIARVWGCNPIIFVGMDLAFTGMCTYASGVVKEIHVDIQNMLQNEDLDDQPILKNDIYGQPIYTLWKWISESQWLSDFSKEHPEIILVNATEGGIGFSGIPNEPFADVIKKHLSNNYELDGRLHGEIQNQMLTQVTSKEIVSLFEELRNSLVRCQEHFDILIEESEKMMKTIEKEKQIPDILQSGAAALAEIELAEEPGYIYLLTMFNIIYSKILNKDLRDILRNEKNAEWQKAIQKIAMNNKKLAFLRDVALANVALMGETLNGL